MRSRSANENNLEAKDIHILSNMDGYHLGRVKWFHPPKGYGFLVDSTTQKEIFVHYTALRRRTPGWRGLWRGEYVDYTSSVNDEGNEAATVIRGVNGGPLMCEASSWQTSDDISSAPCTAQVI